LAAEGARMWMSQDILLNQATQTLQHFEVPRATPEKGPQLSRIKSKGFQQTLTKAPKKKKKGQKGRN